ncbi:hypothetical protein BCR34DRAFT_42551 [Clohesyomyces aquaticus]|uniref:Uncharacterized protein n=1 Tax=Clohesyomyces aquaticus TaxID=1231657 RepID=A0A1Y1Z6B9_9PLEO|nr:hypothetical protein BCR34DRAFT_42551 [Clohesyomyces aquaticus]
MSRHHPLPYGAATTDNCSHFSQGRWREVSVSLGKTSECCCSPEFLSSSPQVYSSHDLSLVGSLPIFLFSLSLCRQSMSSVSLDFMFSLMISPFSASRVTLSICFTLLSSFFSSYNLLRFLFVMHFHLLSRRRFSLSWQSCLLLRGQSQSRSFPASHLGISGKSCVLCSKIVISSAIGPQSISHLFSYSRSRRFHIVDHSVVYYFAERQLNFNPCPDLLHPILSSSALALFPLSICFPLCLCPFLLRVLWTTRLPSFQFSVLLSCFLRTRYFFKFLPALLPWSIYILSHVFHTPSKPTPSSFCRF